jgi:hypothetical protein
MATNRYQPVLLGGLFIGVLSSLPVLKAGNACCCLWVVCGGLLTVYLQQQQKADPLETGEAVLGGLLAGLLGAVINAIVTLAEVQFAGMVLQDQFEQVRSQLEANPDVPPAVRQMVENLLSGRGVVALAVGFSLPMYAVFGMLGALLGLAFFRKKTPPAVPPQQ